MGWKVGLYSAGAGGNGGAEGLDHTVWLTIFAFFFLLPSVLMFSFSQGRNWLYDLTHFHGNEKKNFFGPCGGPRPFP